MKMKLVLLLLFCLTCGRLNAQEPMMAVHNMAFSVLYGFTNAHAINLDLNSKTGSTYSNRFGKPLTMCYEYAVKDDFTIGAVFNYFNYDIKENNSVDSSAFRLKGKQIGLTARALRFVLHRPRMMTYVFVNPGLRFRQQTFSSETNDLFQTSSYSDSRMDSGQFKPYSLEAGIGTKFLVTRRVGLCAEVGMLNAIFQTGLCYIFLESSRKSKDAIGW